MKKKTKYIILITAIILELLGMFFLSRLISGKTDLLVEEKHKLLAFENKGKSLIKLEDDYNLIGDDIEVIDLVLPDKEGLVDLINLLEQQASQAGVLAEVNFTNKSVVVESKTVKSVNFNLTVVGTYYEIIEFIKKVEKLPQVISVEKVSIQAPNGIEDKNNAILSIRCYINPKF